MTNKFLVSVADAIIRDPNTGEALAVGKANMTSAIALTMAKTEVRGGINNPLLFSYFHDRNVEFTIEQVVFGKTLLALNLGSTLTNSAYTMVKTESIVLSSGSGTTTETPLGNVTVFFPNNTSLFVTPVGTSFFVAAGGNQKVTVVYTYTETNVDQIVATSTTPPTVVDLTLIAEVRDETGVISDYLHVNVPRYQVAGNYTLTLNANGVSQESLQGVALVTTSTDTSADYYFKASWIPASATSVPVSDIAATPSTYAFSQASLPDTFQISLLGIRGGLFANVNITNAGSYLRTSGCTTILAGSYTGLITATSAALNGDTATIRATYFDAVSGSLVDNVLVTVTA